MRKGETKMADAKGIEKKYGKYVTPAPIMKIPYVGYTWEGIYGHQGEMKADCTLALFYITETFEEGPPHKHDAHQVMCFVGADLKKMSDFDADIEIALGDELEIQKITSPSVVSIPPGLTHCPLRFTRIGKPVLFIEIVLQNAYQRVKESGEKSFEVYTNLI
jgi:hypothetical protein